MEDPGSNADSGVLYYFINYNSIRTLYFFRK